MLLQTSIAMLPDTINVCVNDPYDVRPWFRHVFLDIWRAERCVFVSGLPGLVGLPVHHPQLSRRSFQYARASFCRYYAFGRCFVFPVFSVKCSVFFDFFSENSASIPGDPDSWTSASS